MSQRKRLCLFLFLWLLLMISLVSGEETPLQVTTLFQTNIDTYDPRLDLRTDGVLVHMHGHDPSTVARAVRDWSTVGNYPVYRMWFIGSDAGEVFTDGRYDGVRHVDAIETGRTGNQYWQPGRPYMVPTPLWNEYMRQITREAIDAGAVGVAPEEPLAHSGAGYGAAFQRAWADFYGEPWQPPHLSVDNHWKSAKLMSHLYLESVKAVVDEAKTYGRSQGKEIEVILPVHSLISHASGSMIFPNGAAAGLPDLDGFIGQVWTGPVGWTLGRYEGRQLTRQNGFFDSAWLLYSSFANLTRGTDKRMFLLADPVEDDPKYRWDQYHQWYNQTLVAKLMFPDVSAYEVMPWPDRIFLPGYSTGGGSPGPAEYLTQLMVNVQALAEMEEQEDICWEGGTQGIGILVGDTFAWQRGGPSGSSIDSFHGLALPLLRRGIPLEVLPIERITDAGYLDPFNLLLLSYDMWKPLAPKAHEALAEWVRSGGVLLFFDGNDPYNQVDEWWQQAGYAAPVEHLFEAMGLDVDLGSRTTVASSGGTDMSEWHELARADADYHNLENLRMRTFDLSSFLPASHLLIRFEDASKGDGWGPYVTQVGFETVGEDGVSRKIAFRADGGVAEAENLVDVVPPGGVDPHRRFADATGYFIYRFPTAGAKEARLQVNVGNDFVIKVQAAQETGEAQSRFAKVADFPNELGEALAALVENRTVPVTSYSFGDKSGAAYQARVGEGAFVYIGLPSALFAATRDGADCVRDMSAYALETLGGGEYRESGSMVLKRGSYVIAHALAGQHVMPGRYVDLLDPTLPVLAEPVVSEGSSALLYDVEPYLGGSAPKVLYASRELLAESTQERTYLVSAGPWNTRGVVRLYGGLHTPAEVRAYALKGFGRRLEAAETLDLTPWIAKMDAGEMKEVSLTWDWDEDSHSALIDFEQWHSGVLIVVEWAEER